MRIRTLKPEFWTSLTVAKLSAYERLTFIGLWNYADDEGRGLYDARLIKAAIWPLENRLTPPKVRSHVERLAELELVTLYEVHERSYLSVNGWGEHQSISKPRPSILPEPPGKPPGIVPDDSSRERKGKEQGKEGKGKDIAPRPRDALFEVVAEVCGIDWHELTDTARGSLNKAVAQLRPLDPDPDDVRLRASHWPYDVPLTPPALAKHWPALRKLHIAKPKDNTVTRALALADRAEGQE